MKFVLHFKTHWERDAVWREEGGGRGRLLDCFSIYFPYGNAVATRARPSVLTQNIHQQAFKLRLQWCFDWNAPSFPPFLSPLRLSQCFLPSAKVTNKHEVSCRQQTLICMTSVWRKSSASFLSAESECSLEKSSRAAKTNEEEKRKKRFPIVFQEVKETTSIEIWNLLTGHHHAVLLLVSEYFHTAVKYLNIFLK